MLLLIGSHNEGKHREIAEVLESTPVKIIGPREVSITEKPDEPADTFAANALHKAQFFFDKCSIPTLADDSGILIEALEGELGVSTRRWGAGPEATDEEWIEHFLDRMSKEENKRARFVCHLAYIDAEGALHTFDGQCDGVITETLEADYLPGLPISACFKPDGFDCVYSAMTLEQKNSTSHRGKALHQFRDFIVNKT